MTTPANPALEQLEPCPWCGGVTHLYQNLQDSSQIQCMSCQAVGPHVYGGNKAIAAWNGGVLRERLKASEEGRSNFKANCEFHRERAEAAEARVAELEKRLAAMHEQLDLVPANHRDIMDNDEAHNITWNAAYLRGRDDGVRIGFEKAREGVVADSTAWLRLGCLFRSADEVLAELRGEKKGA